MTKLRRKKNQNCSRREAVPELKGTHPSLKAVVTLSFKVAVQRA